jgi:CRISPR-associated protein Cmr1
MGDAGSLVVTLETVTPLFLAGAEPRGAPELRPPSFRGALRYWLRAALGGVLGDDIAAVRAAEAAVFGSTEEGLGGAGAVTVRIRRSGPLPTAQYARGGITGRDYLYWSMAPSGRPEHGNYLGPKQYWPEKSAFDLILLPRPGAPNQGEALDRAIAALWLLVQLGGVGSRSRRTAGSLTVRGEAAYAGLPFRLRGTTAAAVAEELGEGLRRVRALCAEAAGGRPPPALTPPTSFDILHPATCQIWVFGPWPSADAAVEALGDRLRDARSKLPLERRAAFGLPMQRVEMHGADRRASPLWLTVTPVGGGWAGIATLFRSVVLPLDAALAVDGAPRPAPADTRDVEAALAAWKEETPGGAEVRYA